METAPARAKAIFSQSGTQCGLFMKGGATAAAQFTQLSLDRDPSHISIKVDFTNAFNTIPRKFLLDQLYDIPELTPFFASRTGLIINQATCFCATRRATLPQCCNRQRESGKAVFWGRSLTESPRCRC